MMNTPSFGLLSVQDTVFPAHPFSGLLAIGRERNWRLHEMFPAFAQTSPQPSPQPSRISYQQARAGLLQARHLGGADLAILSGARKALPQLGGMAAGLRAQTTLAGALAFGLEYQLIAGSMLQLTLERGARQSALLAHSLFDDPELQDFLDADHLATALNAAQQLSGGRLRLDSVELRGNRQASRSLYQDFFACPVSFGADVSRLVFDNRVLELALPAADAGALQAARLACDDELAAFGLRGRASLLRTLVAQQCEFRNVAEMAAALAISPRSLHRWLAREGTSYFQITENVRIERAKRLLQGGVSLEDIAGQLGYSDGRSLRRAFQRWTAQTPAQYRASCSGPE